MENGPAFAAADLQTLAYALRPVTLAPRLFIAAAQVPPGAERVILQGDGFNYLVRVLRMKVGDAFTVFDGDGGEFPAELVSISPDQAEVRLGEKRILPLSPASITLIQAIAKGDHMDLIIQKTTELGVSRIVPVFTSRVVVKLDSKTAEAKLRRWQSIAQEASRQCGRADVPTIELPSPLQNALLRLSPGRRFSLWEMGDGRPLTSCLNELTAHERSLQLLVGPEGGLAAQEIASAQKVDFVPVTLGPRILRTETAAIVAVTLAQAATGGFA